MVKIWNQINQKAAVDYFWLIMIKYSFLNLYLLSLIFSWLNRLKKEGNKYEHAQAGWHVGLVLADFQTNVCFALTT